MADELIWRSEVIDAIYSHNKALLRDEQYRRKRGDIDLLGVIGNINAIPIVDAKPIKHGRWVWDKENDRMYCSECGYETDNWGVHQESDHIEWQLPNYCENCGTRMDEVEE